MLFEPITSCESHFPELREKKALKILEIGVGAGNLFFMKLKQVS